MKEEELVDVMAESMHRQAMYKDKYHRKEKEYEALREEHATTTLLNHILLEALV